MKDLVTGHPYTTETVIQPDQDEFLILACDGVSSFILGLLDPTGGKKRVRANLSIMFSFGTSARIKRLSILFATLKMPRKPLRS
jgi:hypothetical protein